MMDKEIEAMAERHATQYILKTGKFFSVCPIRKSSFIHGAKAARDKMLEREKIANETFVTPREKKMNRNGRK